MADFPPRILALLRDVACRTPAEHFGVWEDDAGEPLQDDADAALAWIDAASGDAARYLRFTESGLPICYRGDDYHDKASLDAAIDADLVQEGKP